MAVTEEGTRKRKREAQKRYEKRIRVERRKVRLKKELRGIEEMKRLRRRKLYGAYNEAIIGKISFKEARERTQALIESVDWGKMKKINY